MPESIPINIRRITHVGPIDDEFVNSIMRIILDYPKEVNVIELLISSHGGSIASGVTAYNYLKTLPYIVHTRNIGYVESAAILPFLAGRIRSAEPMSKFTFHPASIPADGDLSYAKLEEKSRILDTDIAAYAAIVEKEAPAFAKEHDLLHLLRYETVILTKFEDFFRTGILSAPPKSTAESETNKAKITE